MWRGSIKTTGRTSSCLFLTAKTKTVLTFKIALTLHTAPTTTKTKYQHPHPHPSDQRNWTVNPTSTRTSWFFSRRGETTWKRERETASKFGGNCRSREKEPKDDKESEAKKTLWVPQPTQMIAKLFRPLYDSVLNRWRVRTRNYS